jgi:hypothetical protein
VTYLLRVDQIVKAKGFFLCFTFQNQAYPKLLGKKALMLLLFYLSELVHVHLREEMQNHM